MENLILYLFFGLIFGVIGGILFTLLAKHLKGEIRIKIPQRTYKFGDTITGYFTLIAKKEIEGRSLEVHLVGYKRENSYSKDGRKQTHRKEVARFSKDIETDILYHAGLKKDIDFSIEIPSKTIIFGQQQEIHFGDSTLGKLARHLLRPARAQISWQIQVDLESKGLDIHSKKDIFISE